MSTPADANSMRLSKPKASTTRLPAVKPAAMETTASIVIHPMVSHSSRKASRMSGRRSWRGGRINGGGAQHSVMRFYILAPSADVSSGSKMRRTRREAATSLMAHNRKSFLRAPQLTSRKGITSARSAPFSQTISWVIVRLSLPCCGRDPAVGSPGGCLRNATGPLFM